MKECRADTEVVICGGITIFAYTDMVIFARRKKRAYVHTYLPSLEQTNRS